MMEPFKENTKNAESFGVRVSAHFNEIQAHQAKIGFNGPFGGMRFVFFCF